eukprot:TRINITY_DN14273_c0_g3_i1.p1 TRINITY_DN14273_c0_g3~~TRINITY_DN14273_c0_g3_i1.p1  ORF type:complete len:444 (-),score=41.99 TRINITY_DN14273_c0_g3_i1:327-1604(-)
MSVENDLPLLNKEDEIAVSRKGTWAYVSVTNCTVLIGAGVLSLPWSFSQLGWIWGPLALALAFAISFSAAYILSVLHEQDGKRFDQYTMLGQYIFGPILGTWLTTPFQLAGNIGTGIVYIITGSQSLQHVIRLLFPQREELPLFFYVIIFAVIQLLLVQLPDFHSLRWVSFGGALMSVGYCTIAAISALMHVYENDNMHAYVSYGERPGNKTDQFFGDCNAIGSILFSFGGMCTFLEIQAALPSPSQKNMLKGFCVSYSMSLIMYFFVAVSGYLAFGNQVNENVLLSVGKPTWVIAVANAMVFVHVVAAYQVYSMPVFELFQNTIAKKYSKNSYFRFFYRALFVIIGAIIAVGLPFFAAMDGLVGAIGMGMITFILPFIMVLIYFKSNLNMFMKFILIVIVVVMIVLAGLGATGASYNIVVQVLK